MKKALERLFRPIDLTEGKILPSLLRFMIPILLLLFTDRLFNYLNLAGIGARLSSVEVASIYAGGTCLAFFSNFASGSLAGYSVLGAKAAGKKDEGEIRHAFAIEIILTLILGGLTIIVGFLLTPIVLNYIHIAPSESDPAMQKEFELCQLYIYLYLSGLLISLFASLITTFLRSLGDSIGPFVLGILTDIECTGLVYLFLYVTDWGIVGVIVGTLFAQLTNGVISLVYFLHKYPHLRFRKADWAISGRQLWQALCLGAPLGLNFAILQIGVISKTSVVVLFDLDPAGKVVAGIPAQTGYNVAGSFEDVVNSEFATLGTAILSFTGQNYGAKKTERIREGFRSALFLGGIVWLVLGSALLLLSLNGTYQHFYLASDKITSESIRYGNLYLYTTLPFGFLLLLLYVSRNILQGMEKPLFPFLSGVGELTARVLVSTYLPLAINGGSIDSTASSWAFVGLSACDIFSWTSACLLMVPPLLYAFHQMKKKEANDHACLARKP